MVKKLLLLLFVLLLIPIGFAHQTCTFYAHDSFEAHTTCNGNDDANILAIAHTDSHRIEDYTSSHCHTSAVRFYASDCSVWGSYGDYSMDNGWLKSVVVTFHWDTIYDRYADGDAGANIFSLSSGDQAVTLYGCTDSSVTPSTSGICENNLGEIDNDWGGRDRYYNCVGPGSCALTYGFDGDISAAGWNTPTPTTQFSYGLSGFSGGDYGDYILFHPATTSMYMTLNKPPAWDAITNMSCSISSDCSGSQEDLFPHHSDNNDGTDSDANNVFSKTFVSATGSLDVTKCNAACTITSDEYLTCGTFTDSGTCTFSITASDGYDTKTAPIKVTLSDPAPTITSINRNETLHGHLVNFSALAADNSALDGYTFSTNNTGSWINTSWASLSGTSKLISNITNLNSINNTLIGYNWYVNDTGNQLTRSAIYTFVTNDTYMTFTNQARNETRHGPPVNFSILANDADGISGFKFQTNNSGSFANTSWSALSGTSSLIVNQTLITNTNATTIGWSVFVNDSGNLLYKSSEQKFMTNDSYMTIRTMNHNSSIFSSPCNFSVWVQDNETLSGFIFSTNNTNSWVNDSWKAMSGTSTLINVSKILNSVGGIPIGWKVYVNETYGLNYLGEDQFLITDSSSPTLSNYDLNTTKTAAVGNFSVLLADNYQLYSYIFTTNNTGTWVNDTQVLISGTSQLISVTKTINDTVRLIGWNIFANDTTNNLAKGTEQTFTSGLLGISGIIFSTNNTGSWTNDSWININQGGSPVWGNTSKLLNSTHLSLIGWKVWSNDSDNLWNSSSIHTLMNIDTQIAVFSNYANNDSEVDHLCNFSELLTDPFLEGYIFSTNNSGSWVNDTYIKHSGTTLAQNVSYLPGSIITMGWKFYANDTSGNIANGTEHKFRVYTYPRLSDYSSNETTINQPVNVSALGMDASGLEGYILSTNNTGVWINSTYFDLIGFDTVLLNQSFILNDTVTTIGWKFFLNDSSNVLVQGDETGAIEMKINLVEDSPPTFSNQNRNETLHGHPVNLSILITDNYALEGYFYSTNFSGSWTNESYHSLSGLSALLSNSTLIKNVNNTALGWKVFANDTYNNIAVSSEQKFITNDTYMAFTDASSNQTEVGNPVNMSMLINDSDTLYGYTFSTNNSGVWINTSFASLTGTTYLVYNGTLLNSTHAGQKGWIVFANDTSGLLYKSSEQNINILSTTKPKWYDNSSNNVFTGVSTIFSVRWTSTIHELANYIFSTNNTGTWTNDTMGTTSGTNTWINTTKILNDTVTTVGWKMWANDTANNMNVTLNPTGEFIIHTAPSAPYPPTNLTIDHYWTDADLNGTYWGWIEHINCSGGSDPDGHTLNYTLERYVNSTWTLFGFHNSTFEYANWSLAGIAPQTDVAVRCRMADTVGAVYSDYYSPLMNLTISDYFLNWTIDYPSNAPCSINSFAININQSGLFNNFTPNKQNDTCPAFNITNLGSTVSLNLTVKLNDTSFMPNLTFYISNQSTRIGQAQLLTGTEKWILVELIPNNFSGLWVWADAASNYTWSPIFFGINFNGYRDT